MQWIDDRIMQARQWFRNYLRHMVAALLTLAVLFCTVVFVWPAWLEIGGADIGISMRSLTINSLQTHVTLDTFDPDNLTVAAHISTTSDEAFALSFDPSITKQISELKNLSKAPSSSEYTVYYRGPYISDLAPIWSSSGTRFLRQEVQPEKIKYSDFCALKNSLENKLPNDTTMSLTMLGDPRLFPFDRYLILYEGKGTAYLEYDGKVADINSAFTIATRFPGLLVRDFAGAKLRDYDGNAPQMFLQSPKSYNPQFWYTGGFAISVERPLYLRVLAIVLGTAALISVFFVSFRSEPSTYLLNAAGTFVALWGARSVLTANAPKTPNLIDFGVLALFIIQVGIGLVRIIPSKELPTTPESM